MLELVPWMSRASIQSSRLKKLDPSTIVREGSIFTHVWLYSHVDETGFTIDLQRRLDLQCHGSSSVSLSACLRGIARRGVHIGGYWVRHVRVGILRIECRQYDNPHIGTQFFFLYDVPVNTTIGLCRTRQRVKFFVVSRLTGRGALKTRRKRTRLTSQRTALSYHGERSDCVRYPHWFLQ